ncbi:hypothetical protein [Chania multitudinisentens]|uniref:hypothetical protein n=1 Tax=Chania multitudinisentens TaxID=1639108 RepID=UPI0003E1415C|nr:hypothetical protein [Chania multitudinisentens]
MDDEDYIHDLVWDREELYKESLEDEFFYYLNQIENKSKRPANSRCVIKVV